MARAGWKRYLFGTAKWAISLLVLWYVARHARRTWNDLSSRAIAPEFHAGWLVGSGVLYITGLACYGRFFERILRSSATPVPLLPALRAYLISHLGKYVPGKAMVVIVRTGLVAPFGARPATAAIATFYETLVMMAAGGWVAAAGFGLASASFGAGGHKIELALPRWETVRVPVYPLGTAASIGMGLLFLVTVLPVIFRKLAVTISMPIPGVGPDAMPTLSGRLLLRGIVLSTIGWILLGLSLLAVLGSFLPNGVAAVLERGLIPIGIASVAFATIAGFLVAVLPGGLGVREGVMISTLSPVLGADDSVVAALLLRLVWMAAEVVAALVLFAAIRPPRVAIHVSSEAGQNLS